MSSFKFALGFLSSLGAAFAFRPLTSAASPPRTILQVTVDPSVVNKNEYNEICGGDVFDPNEFRTRLEQSQQFVYPKHVEVIEDIAPIANTMVDKIVSYIHHIDGEETCTTHTRLAVGNWRKVVATTGLSSGHDTRQLGGRSQRAP